ncbi:MAG TPA: serine hydrolase domain-containing protein, partial [Chryseosolibacter sp.]|nr:serine hydrolase domain-containing protein [Chryseosolibacter sp.]
MAYSMIKSYLHLSFLIIVLFACKTRDEKAKGLSAELDSVIAQVPDFSGVVMIAENGTPVFHKAYGYRNFNDSVPMDTGSIFELASLSKQFTAMAIMILKQEGKLNYDDLVEKYIPGLPYPGITIR